VTIRQAGKGKIAAVHGAFMRSYYLTHQPRLRQWLRELLDELQIRRRIEITAPPSVEATVREGEKFLAVHLVNRAANPSLTPHLHLVEEVPPTGEVIVRVRVEKPPAQLSLEPGGRIVAWDHHDGWVEARVPSVSIHEIVVIAS